MMKSVAMVSGLLVLVIATPTTSAPNKPINAADVDKGMGCMVRGNASQAYVYDAACEFKSVTKADKDGNRVFYRYQDKGTLQSGQAAPERATFADITMTIAGQNCSGKEVITPSGNYSSNLTCE